MLREGILKENIDGEALVGRMSAFWPVPRTGASSSSSPMVRRWMIPLSVNSGSYLEKHLREVIGYIETCSPVELLAIGIGYDVTLHYWRAVTINDVDQLGGAVVGQPTDLFDEDANRRTRESPEHRAKLQKSPVA